MYLTSPKYSFQSPAHTFGRKQNAWFLARKTVNTTPNISLIKLPLARKIKLLLGDVWKEEDDRTDSSLLVYRLWPVRCFSHLLLCFPPSPVCSSNINTRTIDFSSECGQWQLSQTRLYIFPAFCEQCESMSSLSTSGRWKRWKFMKEAETEEEEKQFPLGKYGAGWLLPAGLGTDHKGKRPNPAH